MFLWLHGREYKGRMYYSATGCYNRIRKRRQENMQNCNLICWFLYLSYLTVTELPTDLCQMGALRGISEPKRASNCHKGELSYNQEGFADSIPNGV
jgi:hypothetical protein